MKIEEMELCKKKVYHNEEELRAATTMETRVEEEARAYLINAPSTDKKEKKKRKRNVQLIEGSSSTSSQQQQEEENHPLRAYCYVSMTDDDEEEEEEEKKRKVPLTKESSPPSSSSSLSSSSSSSSCSHNQQRHEKHPITKTGIWRQVAAQRGLSEPKFCLKKKVTITDAKKNQNRLEIGKDDFDKSMMLLKFAIRSHSKASQDVMVMDKKGREYNVFFKFIDSNCRYRFNGSEWGRFMKDNRLQAGQMLRIYGLGDDEGGDYGFAFINTQE